MEILVAVFSECRYATATIFPSIEYVDEKHCELAMCDVKGMVLIRPPVWRSQVLNSW